MQLRSVFFAFSLLYLWRILPVAATVGWTGVNLAGAEFASGANWPTTADMDYFASKGMNIFRIPFGWERMQPTLKGAFNSEQETALDGLVTYATQTLSVYVLLDPHNYARYNGQILGDGLTNDNLADLWTRLANKYKSNDKVLFGLMNEPKEMPNNDWRDAAQAAVSAIRNAEAQNYILLPGNGWTGAHSWLQNWYDLKANPARSNAETMIEVIDPLNRMIYEVHQYFDENYGGLTSFCQASPIGRTTLEAFTNWLKQNGKKGFLGEFGGAQNSACSAALTDALQYMDDNSDVWVGWTYWAAGLMGITSGQAWPDDYFFSIQPTNNYGTDRSQMQYIQPFISTGTPFSIPMTPFTYVPTTTNPATPTATQGCPNGNSQDIYTDSLQNGWEDWSWAADRTLTDTSQKHSGSSSVSFVPTNFEAIYFARSDTFSTSSYSGVEFYINGAPNGGQQIRVGFRKNSNEYGTPVGVNVNEFLDDASSIGDMWTRVYVPFSAMQIGAGDSLMGITIQADIQGTQARVFVDDVRLVCIGSSSPSVTNSPGTPSATLSSDSSIVIGSAFAFMASLILTVVLL